MFPTKERVVYVPRRFLSSALSCDPLELPDRAKTFRRANESLAPNERKKRKKNKKKKKKERKEER